MAITDGDVIASNDLATAFDSRMGFLNLSKLLGNRANVFSHKRTISNASALLLRRRRFVPAQDMRVNYIRIGATGAAVGSVVTATLSAELSAYMPTSKTVTLTTTVATYEGATLDLSASSEYLLLRAGVPYFLDITTTDAAAHDVSASLVLGAVRLRA